MLDVSGAWDSIIERFVAEPATRHRIFDNPFYKSLTSEFAGAEAFAALQRLYDLHQAGSFSSKSWIHRPRRIRLSSCKRRRVWRGCSIRAPRDGCSRHRCRRGDRDEGGERGGAIRGARARALRRRQRALDYHGFFRGDGGEHGRDHRPPAEDGGVAPFARGEVRDGDDGGARPHHAGAPSCSRRWTPRG